MNRISKGFLMLPITLKKGVMNTQKDIQWYTTMTKVAISIVNESSGMKCHGIKCKFVNKSLLLVNFVKKSLPF